MKGKGDLVVAAKRRDGGKWSEATNLKVLFMFMDGILTLDIFLVYKNGKHEYNHDPYFPKEYIKGDNLYYSFNVCCSNYQRYKDLKKIYIKTSENVHYKFKNIIDFSELNGTAVFVFKRLN